MYAVFKNHFGENHLFRYEDEVCYWLGDTGEWEINSFIDIEKTIEDYDGRWFDDYDEAYEYYKES